MEEVRGIRRDTVRYMYDGYEYHIDTTSPHLFRCATRTSTKCRGAAQVNGQRPQLRVVVYTPHDCHPPNPTIVQEARMREEMLNLAVETNDTLKSIFDAVCARYPVEVAQNLRFPAMKNAMDRARKTIRPLIPASLRDLAGALENHEPTSQIYRGLVEADDSVALVFVSNDMIEVLNSAREIFIDGTFKVAPNQPPIAQLYTIHVRILDTGLAAVFVLCSARTLPLYRAIFRRVLQLAPGIGATLRFVMGDYERAAMSAIRDVFPRTSLHGCWFHFSQALERRWRRLGLSNAPRRILSLAMALPLAPAANFAEGLALLGEQADAIAGGHPQVLQFMLYLRRQWCPLAEVVSVHGCPVRTNNLVEAFHNEAKRKLGGLHPNIWKFIDHLSKTIINQDQDLARLRNGDRPRRARALKSMARDTLIRDAQHDLSVGRLTLMEFLQRCSTRVYPVPRLQPEHYAEGVEEAADMDDELVPPGLLAEEDPRVDEPVRRDRGRARRARGRGAGPIARDELALDEADEPVPVNGGNDRARGRARGGRRARGLARGGAGGRGADHMAQNDPALDELDEPLNGDHDRVIDVIDDIDEQVRAVPDAPEVAQPEQVAPPAAAQLAPQAAALPGPEAIHIPHNCCVCMDQPATHAYVPCGHKCCCENCALNWPRNCPLCRMECLGVFLIRSP